MRRNEREREGQGQGQRATGGKEGEPLDDGRKRHERAIKSATIAKSKYDRGKSELFVASIAAH